MKRRDFIYVLGGAVSMAIIAPLIALKEPYQFCDESLSVFYAMAVQPDMDWKIAFDLRVRYLKDNGVWDKLDLLYTCDVKELQNKYNNPINWINPQQRL